MNTFSAALTAAVHADTDTIILKAAARTLAKMIEASSLYAADPEIRLAVKETLRLTSPPTRRDAP